MSVFAFASFRKACFGVVLILLAVSASSVQAADITVTDAWGRTVTVPEHPQRVICSGPGCLRYLVYLQAQDRVAAVDDMEKSRETFKARPYYLAHPELRDYPLFGEFRGHDNPELIVALDPAPQVIFKTYGNMGHDPEELQAKTGIPVVVLNYGDLAGNRKDMIASLELMAEILGKEERAAGVLAFIDKTIADLQKRTDDIPICQRPTCFVGGIAHKGPHGFSSTEPSYPPFAFVNALNVAADPESETGGLSYAEVAREQIVAWDPDFLFVDLSTIQGGEKAGAIHQLKTEPCYQALKAVGDGRVYGVLPYNWYTQNYGSILADAYFVGKTVYPERFKDVDPAVKADEIYAFLVGEPVFEAMNESFENLAFSALDMSGTN
ncbi:MAG: iron ABC transporter substrate-binding protein [Synergistota bacterium]|nr:iron ABC transporter substrate-binding protein [Synergistota bacterium]